MAVPTDIANLSVWYKADAVTGLSDGAQLAAWPDSSGNGYTTEQPFGFKPTYETGELNSLPVVRFKSPGDSSDRSLRSSAPISTSNKTVFLVLRPSQVGNTATPQTIWGGDNASLRLRILSGKFDLTKVGTAVLVTGATTPSDGVGYVVCATFISATSATIYLNGTQDATATHAQALTASSFTYLGGSGLFGGEPYFGDLAEVVAYDAALADTDRDAITSYLGNKYGITVAGGAPATNVGAGTASATGVAPGSTVRVVATAATASATGTAGTATTSTGMVVTAATANTTSAALAGTGRITTVAGTAQTTGAAGAATASARTVTTTANATGAANASVALTSVSPTATAANATGAALSPGARVTVAPARAATAGSAFNAVGTSNSNVVVVAGVARATGASSTTNASATTTTVSALATGQAPAAAAGGSTSATLGATPAQATGQASPAAGTARTVLAPAAAIGQAPAAAASSSTNATAFADIATATGQAAPATAVTGRITVAQAATAIGTAGGGAVTSDEGEPGPTIIGVAEVAASAGSAAWADVRVLVRAVSALGRGSAAGGQISQTTPPWRRPRAGTPRRSLVQVAGAPVRRPASSRPFV